MDKIFLQDMKVETVIGIWEWERKIRQTVAIDLDMSADIRKAAASDKVEDTLHYKPDSKPATSSTPSRSRALPATRAPLKM